MVCRPEGGKRAAGGQKLRWNDVVARDVKKCEMLSEWRSVAKDRREWRGKVAAAVEDLNEEAEKQEKQRKDERKRRREEAAATGDMWPCGLRGCVFAAQTKADLVNHQRQKHGPQVASVCRFCGERFQRQGLRNHEKACERSV